MACGCNSNTKSNALFETTAEAREKQKVKILEHNRALGNASRELEKLLQQQQIDEARKQAAALALQKAEMDAKVRERDIYEKQYQDLLLLVQQMQDQYNTFTKTAEYLAVKVQNPEQLFPSSIITSIETFEDYVSLGYDDGRKVRVPNKVIDTVLSGTLNAIGDIFDKHQTDIVSNAAKIGKLECDFMEIANLFEEMTVAVSKNKADQQAVFNTFKQEVNEELNELREGLNDLADTIKNMSSVVVKYTQTVDALKNN